MSFVIIKLVDAVSFVAKSCMTPSSNLVKHYPKNQLKMDLLTLKKLIYIWFSEVRLPYHPRV